MGDNIEQYYEARAPRGGMVYLRGSTNQRLATFGGATISQRIESALDQLALNQLERGAEIREADAALAEAGIYPGNPLRPLADRIRELAARAGWAVGELEKSRELLWHTQPRARPCAHKRQWWNKTTALLRAGWRRA